MSEKLNNNISEFPQFDDESKTAAELIAEQSEELEQENDRKLMEAIAEAREKGKEDFDVTEFAKYYRGDPLTGEQINEDTDEKVIEGFMSGYYLDFPDINNVADYARELNKYHNSLE